MFTLQFDSFLRSASFCIASIDIFCDHHCFHSCIWNCCYACRPMSVTSLLFFLLACLSLSMSDLGDILIDSAS